MYKNVYLYMYIHTHLLKEQGKFVVKDFIYVCKCMCSVMYLINVYDSVSSSLSHFPPSPSLSCSHFIYLFPSRILSITLPHSRYLFIALFLSLSFYLSFSFSLPPSFSRLLFRYLSTYLFNI